MRTSDGSLDRYYNYNQKGQLSNQSYSGYFGLYKDQNFSYNADGYLFNMTDDPASTTNTIDQFGRVTQHQLVDMNGGNTLYTTGYTYVTGGGGANATTTLVDTESISGFGSYNYSYMPNGNIYWVTVTPVGGGDEDYYDIAYEYDEFGQLITEYNRHTKQTLYYTYDAGGNITSRQTYDGVWWDFDESSLVTDTYTYGDSQWKDLLTAYNGQTITYDEIGNPLTYKNGEAMTWVGGRRLYGIDFDGHGDLLFFDYDSDGMRLRKYGPRVDDYNYAFANTPLFYVDYYYDGDTLIYERRSYNGDNESTLFTIEYLYGVNGITGFKINNGTTATTYYYVKNIMGDVLGIVDASGTLVAEYRYDAYGNHVMILDGNGNDVSSNYAHIANINPIRYRGYYYDVESGFYYLNSRYYDPEIGRFINADGYVSTGQGVLGNNMFAYCLNNPVNMVDYGGQCSTYPNKPTSADILIALQCGDCEEQAEHMMNVVLGIETCEAGFYTGLVDKNTPPDHPEYIPPKDGPRRGKTKNGELGWVDKKGNIWIPTRPMDGSAEGGWVVVPKHGKPGEHSHKYPGGGTRTHRIEWDYNISLPPITGDDTPNWVIWIAEALGVIE